MGFRCLMFGCQDPLSSYSLVFSVFLCQWACLSCVLRACEMFGETIRNILSVVVIECYGVV